MGRLGRVGRGSRLAIALAVGAALFGIAAAVQADIPDSGVIHGCYAKFNLHSLRVIDSSRGEHCLSNEIALDWNQTGPTGGRGATGPTGPSDAYTAYQGSYVVVAGGSQATVVSLALSTGRYTLSGTLTGQIKPAAPGPNELAAGFCAYATSGGASTLHQGSGDWSYSNYDEGDMFKSTFPLIGDITVTTGPTTVNLYCDNVDSGAEDVHFSGALIATRIGTLH